MKHFFMIVLAWVFLITAGFAHLPTCRAQVAQDVVEEATAQIFKQAGKEAVEQLDEMGGKAAVTEVLQKASDEGGDALVKRATRYTLEDGPIALRVIGNSPAKMVDALDGLAPELRTAAMDAVQRDPTTLTAIVRQYGSGALEAAARQPGIGEKLVATLGSDGISLSRQLGTDDAILLARHADEIEQLAPVQRTAVLRKIADSPRRILDFLESHPKILLTTAGVAPVIGTKDDLLGDRGSSVVRNDGTVITTPPHPGLLERLYRPTIALVEQPVAWIGEVAAGGLAVWIAIHLYGKWRIRRLRYLAEKNQIEAHAATQPRPPRGQ